ncbi:glycosyltransferase family 4 protein [Phycicoccus flavus]|uniref:glycosyltransferase family 4 protein n=1 Tax=Phycicoccus flavus TaxID=2502783 RepID=UPI000FEBC4D9|nr:glycosyltransferase family 4 protein [Phycicoccus flavus]NHA69158.1 glycosyltransferase family 4 protein [Phycicoccus flavus]
MSTRSLRVALYHHLPPGGALRVVREFLTRLPDDVEVDLYGLEDGPGSPFPRASTLVPPGVTPRLVPLDGGRVAAALSGRLARPALATRLASAEARVADAVNRGGYDVAYVHPCWMSNAPGLVAELRVPTVLYLQEVRRATFEPSYRHRPAATPRTMPGIAVIAATESLLARRDRQGVGAATAVAANSLYSAERILASYGRTAEVVALGVDERTFHPRVVDTPGRPLVLAVGGLEPFKNQLDVVRAVGGVPTGLRPTLVLVHERCDEQYRTQVLSEAARLDVEVVERRGISDDELAQLYSQASATLLAAQLEPLGLTALESIACGTPVVAVQEAGYRETVGHGVNGLLVPRAVDGLADALTAVLAGKAGLVDRGSLPGTILPFWSQARSAARQLNLLRRTAARRPE